jgi:iron complex outermembrane receptor protein
VGDALSLNGGLRQERGKLEVDTFTTLAFYGPVTVDGGEPEFTETLPNIGATWFAGEAFNLFASYAEGYTMPDVGRVLRGIDEPGLDVDSFLNLAPVIADNREVGLEYAASSFDARVSYFTSEADSGARLQFDPANQVYNVVRERTAIEGVEARIGWTPTETTQLSLGYAAINGRSDRDRDGRVDSDLDGANISPDRLNLGWTQAFGDAWSTRVQVNHFLDRDFERQGQPAGAFDGYTTADAFVRFDADRAGLWTLGLENLADKDYISYNSQTVGDDESYFAGRGRVLSLTWQARF